MEKVEVECRMILASEKLTIKSAHAPTAVCTGAHFAFYFVQKNHSPGGILSGRGVFIFVFTMLILLPAGASRLFGLFDISRVVLTAGAFSRCFMMVLYNERAIR